MYLNLAIIGAFIFLYSILSGKLERTPINGAIVFTAFGFIFGSLGLGLLKLNIDSEMVGVLAELTLAMVLFIDASNANLGVLKKSSHIPQRLLVIALPLIILLGFGVGYFLFDNLTLLEIAILATMLAPTDAALGKVVVTNKSVPVDIWYLDTRIETDISADWYRGCSWSLDGHLRGMDNQDLWKQGMDNRDLEAVNCCISGCSLFRYSARPWWKWIHRFLRRRVNFRRYRTRPQTQTCGSARCRRNSRCFCLDHLGSFRSCRGRP
jgi:hypothetical protein